ncbi:MAG: type II CAAX prenyl endopeptidase Rce1 family protein [Patescibacteria group bacterium]
MAVLTVISLFVPWFFLGVKYAMLIHLVAVVIFYATQGGMQINRNIVRSMTYGIWLQAIALVLSAQIIAKFISDHVPAFNWSLLQELFGIEGSLLSQSTSENLFMPLATLVLLTIIIPGIAMVEEHLFRKAIWDIVSLDENEPNPWFPKIGLFLKYINAYPSTSWIMKSITILYVGWPTSGLIFRSVIFGLAHLVGGVSIGVALMIILMGLILSYEYRQNGLDRAVAMHTAYNWINIILAFIILLF